MALEILDPSDFLDDNLFRQEFFLQNIARFDWSRFEGKRVLVRGCTSALLPPWAMMRLTAMLIPHARTIYYGNEHDNVVVYKHEQQT